MLKILCKIEKASIPRDGGHTTAENEVRPSGAGVHLGDTAATAIGRLGAHPAVVGRAHRENVGLHKVALAVTGDGDAGVVIGAGGGVRHKATLHGLVVHDEHDLVGGEAIVGTDIAVINCHLDLKRGVKVSLTWGDVVNVTAASEFHTFVVGNAGGRRGAADADEVVVVLHEEVSCAHTGVVNDAVPEFQHFGKAFGHLGNECQLEAGVDLRGRSGVAHKLGTGTRHLHACAGVPYEVTRGILSFEENDVTFHGFVVLGVKLGCKYIQLSLTDQKKVTNVTATALCVAVKALL